MKTLDDLAAHLRKVPRKGRRRVIAIVGPPASGKSTIADALAAHEENAKVVPMDGFHLDNPILTARGLLNRKGAPETFDARGFLYLIKRLQTEEEVVFPIFDRALDRSIAGAGVIDAACDLVIVEGNYLLLDQPVWRDLSPLWDYSVNLRVPREVLRKRLIQRWASYGYAPADAALKADGNDMLNADTIVQNALPCDLVLDEFEDVSHHKG